MVTKERADPVWPPSLPSLISGIALLAQSISAGPRSGRGGWKGQGELLALLSTGTTRLWSSSFTCVERLLPHWSLVSSRAKMEQKGSQGSSEVICPSRCMGKWWRSRDTIPVPIPILLSVDVIPAELKSQGDDVNTAGIFPVYPDATLGRDSACAFFWALAVMAGTCRRCRRWLCLSLLCHCPQGTVYPSPSS